jgi:SulP family sulfate permease
MLWGLVERSSRLSQLSQLIRGPFIPFWESTRGYNQSKLRQDILAGLTVSVVALPQAMAYAFIADVPMQYGVYAVIIQCFVGSLFNSQKFLSLGPTNTQSLLVASTVTRLAGGHPALYLQLVIGLTLIKGLMQVTMACARLGGLVRFVSQSVIIGFTAGAGVLIAAGQVNWLLGFSVQRSKEQYPGIVGIIQRLIPHLHEIKPMSIVVGVGCLAIVIGVRRLAKLAPGPLLAVVVAAVFVAAMGLTNDQLPLMKQLPSASEALRIFEVPSLTMGQVEQLLGGAMALALLGLLEAYSIGKTIAAKTGQTINANQELLSQGMTNVFSSFFQCIPGSGSFARSALNHYAGAATAYAGIFNAIFVATIFLLFSRWATFIPMASLAAILFVIAFGLLDYKYFFKLCRSNKADAMVYAITFLATLFIPLSYAVFVGIFLNLALFIQRSSQLHIAEMVRSSAGPFVEQPLQEKQGRRSVLFLQMEGDLFFGVADELRARLTRIHLSGARVVIFRLKRTHAIDSTVMQVMEDFVKQMIESGRYVVLCGVRDDLMDEMKQYGLVGTIGMENVFPTSYGVFASAQRALDRAKELVGGSIDASEIADQEDLEGWSYEI